MPGYITNIAQPASKKTSNTSDKGCSPLHQTTEIDSQLPPPNSLTSSIAPSLSRSDQTYQNLAEEGYVHSLQASGMQPIRDYWASPEKLGYSEENSKKALAFRENIPKKIITLNQQGYHSSNLTRRAHTEAAAEARTAPPSGDVMYYGGELLSGVLSSLAGTEVASKVFGPLSRAFNDPIGTNAKANRDNLSDTFEKVGRQLLRSQNRVLKTAGVATSILGRSMAVTNTNAELEYQDLITPREGKLTSSPSPSSTSTKHSTIRSTSASSLAIPTSRNALAVPIPFPPQEWLLNAAFAKRMPKKDNDSE